MKQYNSKLKECNKNLKEYNITIDNQASTKKTEVLVGKAQETPQKQKNIEEMDFSVTSNVRHLGAEVYRDNKGNHELK